MVRRAAMLAAVTAMVAALLLLAFDGGPASAATGGTGKVLVVSVPRLVWQDIADHQPPALLRFLRGSAYASLSVRAIGAETDLGEAYVSIGAGNRARVDPLTAGNNVGAAEVVDGKTGADLYRTATGRSPAGAAVLSLVIDEARADARHMLYGAEPGALGQTLDDHGKRAAVIANGDGGPPAGADVLHREAALAVMDEAGRVAGGVVDPSLAVADPAAPAGYRMDDGAVVSAFARAWSTHDVVLVELSDLERLERSLGDATAAEREAALAQPLRRADALFGSLLEHVDPTRDRVLLVSPAAPHDRGQLTVFAMAGPGIPPGQARSATTRRDGYVTLPDIGVTVLDALGLKAPDSMNATAITSAGGAPFTRREASRLTDLDALARYRDRTVGPVSVIYIVLQVLTYGLAALALARARPDRSPLRRGVRSAALTIIAVPLVVFMSGLAGYDRLALGVYVVFVFVASAVVGLAAAALARVHPFLPAFALIAANWALQVLDVAFGGRLQLNTSFGYSPIVAGRFEGFGNLAFAVLAAAAIVVATGTAGLGRPAWPPDGAVGYVASRRVLLGAIGVFALTFLVDGHPSLGSDVGGVLATVPAFALVVLLLGGWRVSLRKVLLIVLGTVVAISALAALDLSRPADKRTHLGRFANDLFDGHAGVVIERKVQSNWFVLTSSVWTWLVPVCLGFVVFLAARRHGYLHRLQRRVPGVRPCLLGALVVGVLGFALNDSGVAVPAMMFGIVLPWITWLLLATESAGPSRPDGGGSPGGDVTAVADASASSRSLEPTP
jgi:hypothetical protein